MMIPVPSPVRPDGYQANTRPKTLSSTYRKGRSTVPSFIVHTLCAGPWDDNSVGVLHASFRLRRETLGGDTITMVAAQSKRADDSLPGKE